MRSLKAKHHEWSDVLLVLSCRLSSRDMSFNLVLWMCTHEYRKVRCGMSSSEHGVERNIWCRQLSTVWFEDPTEV